MTAVVLSFCMAVAIVTLYAAERWAPKKARDDE